MEESGRERRRGARSDGVIDGDDERGEILEGERGGNFVCGIG